MVETRLDRAKRRAAAVKTGAAVGAVTAFAVSFGLFRSHHATASTGSTSDPAPVVQQESADDGGYFGDGSGDLAPSSSPPQARTGAS